MTRTVYRDAGSIAQSSRKDRPQPMKDREPMPGPEIGHSSQNPEARSVRSSIAHRPISNRLRRRLKLLVSYSKHRVGLRSNRPITRFLRPPWRTTFFSAHSSAPCRASRRDRAVASQSGVLQRLQMSGCMWRIPSRMLLSIAFLCVSVTLWLFRLLSSLVTRH
jgi:hypothetical protein